MDLFNLNTLALGGVAAAVVAGWNQVKQFSRYLSSCIVIQADFDLHISGAMVAYLKAHYKRMPSGLRTYFGRVDTLRDRSLRVIPYRVINMTSVFYRKGSVVVLNINQGSIKVMTLRGMTDVDQLVINALNFDHDLTTKERQRNHFVVRVFGEEKGAWSNRGSQISGGEASTDAPLSAESNSSYRTPNPRFDRSFMFDPDMVSWQQPGDAFETLFYEPAILNHVEHARKWLASSRWYEERGIPWRRGWLLHGPGGTGKSSLALATAKTMGVPIYHYYLNTLSDREFTSEWNRMTTPCIALFEDFDTVFDKRENLTEHKSLSFDTVLNTISGVSNRNGVFLIVTTNHINKIDEALGVAVEGSSISTRPGRVDEVIYLGLASDDVRRKIGMSILRDWPEMVEPLLQEHPVTTPVQFQELCIQAAFNRLAKEKEVSKPEVDPWIIVHNHAPIIPVLTDIVYTDDVLDGKGKLVSATS